METGSVAKRAIALLTERGALRTAQIAEALGVSMASVSGSLGAYVSSGALAACKVEQPGTPPTNEYRISASGKAPNFREYKVKDKPRAAAPVPAAAAAELAAPKPAKNRSAPVRKVQRNTATLAERPGVERKAPKGWGTIIDKFGSPSRLLGKSPAVAASAFRTAIASDGAMIFLGAAAGAFELNRGEARAVIDFVRTLDRGEAGA